jgi:hypothetical protein
MSLFIVGPWRGDVNWLGGGGATMLGAVSAKPQAAGGRVSRFAIPLLIAWMTSAASAQTPPVTFGRDGKLVYRADERGNRVPDFSHCGYAGADRPIPRVAVRVTVAPGEGDDGGRIQRAIDHVASLPVGEDGFRGAVLLLPGKFQVAGQVQINASGVVLRGSGAVEGGTTIVATGLDRRPLVKVAGGGPRELRQGEEQHLADSYVPAGSRRFKLAASHGLRKGQAVQVANRISEDFIVTLGAHEFGVGWRPAWILWDRHISGVDGDTVTLDAPVTMAVGADFQTDLEPVSIVPYTWPGRIEQVGVEDLVLESDYRRDHPLDEEHAWHGVVLNNVQNAWVRQVMFRHFAGGAVLLREGTKWVTVEDCASAEPVSELGGYRRNTFFTQGQLTLFLRCWSEEGLHDFCVGHMAAGPNAFVNCRAERTLGDSGPRERWATGVLYDNVRIDGAGLHLENRWASPPGTGWAAANSMLWNCRAATMRVFRPPTATNWAVGVWAELAGDGEFFGESDFAEPLSLYQAQLAERIGREAAAERVGPILGAPIGATNPTLEEAQRFVAASNEPARRLVDDIEENMRGGAERAREDARGVAGVESSSPQQSPVGAGGGEDADPSHPQSAHALQVKNGWLVIDGRVVTGGRLTPTWWRGNIRPEDAPMMGPAITRFAPGRDGLGLTDDLTDVANRMTANRQVVYDHHYGLWYDRRRDDHLMERRADGEVAPPFYEQPFARTGQGRAWDGLSKYDLTKFSPWYWSRLHDFAKLCDERGLVLFHQNYFQHNILEAGAHWVDSPWRPANNVNDTPFPEPPPFVGDKRIFLAHKFYDVADQKLRELHRGYIRQCLDAFADCSNVVQMTSAEYSGPLEFVEFWIDCVGEWEDERQQNVIVGLSVPKDVQDAILADEKRARRVEVIDIRYWAYTADGGLYAPTGGQNLAPRQHLRMTRQKPGGAAAIYQAVSEYRTRFPYKAVTYYAEEHSPSIAHPWATLMAGGSVAAVPLPAGLAEAAVEMKPAGGVTPHGWALSRDEDYLIYIENDEAPWELAVPAGTYRVHWMKLWDGALSDSGEAISNGKLRLKRGGRAAWLRRIEAPARSAPQTPRRG